MFVMVLHVMMGGVLTVHPTALEFLCLFPFCIIPDIHELFVHQRRHPSG